MVPDHHVQVVQNMYAKGGSGVFKAELWPAEVDPRFKICLDQFAVLRNKDAPSILVRSLGNQ